MTRRRTARRACAALLLAGPVACAWAQPAGATSGSSVVYSCQTAQGIITSDRYIAQCSDREQRVYNRDGTASRVIPPNWTASERAAIEARQAKEQAAKDAISETVRRDQQLFRRFSSEESHQRARDKSLEPALNAQRLSQARLALLEQERKPLLEEAEFYKGKKLPPKLQLDFDVLDASVEAIQVAMKAQREEMARVNELYDIELERLKKLWAGAVPGSLGPMRSPTDDRNSQARRGADPGATVPSAAAVKTR